MSTDSTLPVPAPSFAPRLLRQRILLETVASAILGRGDHPDRLARVARWSERLDAHHPQTAEGARPLMELEADRATPELVAALTDGYRRPIVIRGLARAHAAVRRWTPDYFAERLPDAECTVFRPNEEVGFGLGTAPLERLPVADFMKRVLDEPLYLNNSTELFALDPELVDELELSRVQDAVFGASLGTQLFATQFFIGSQCVHSRLHQAVGGNAFMQVRGRKRWTFVDPIHTPRLMPIPGGSFYFTLSGHGGFRRRRELGLPPGLLAHIPRFETVLEPGDVLYNAPWWWHEVENLDPGTIGCAVRRMPPHGTISPSFRNLPAFTLASMYPARRVLAALVEAVGWLAGGRVSLMRRANRVLHERLHNSLSERKAA